jgi:hypothetical protein
MQPVEEIGKRKRKKFSIPGQSPLPGFGLETEYKFTQKA